MWEPCGINTKDSERLGATVRDSSLSADQEKTPILIGETGPMRDSDRIDFSQVLLTLGARGVRRQPLLVLGLQPPCGISAD